MLIFSVRFQVKRALLLISPFHNHPTVFDHCLVYSTSTTWPPLHRAQKRLILSRGLCLFALWWLPLKDYLFRLNKQTICTYVYADLPTCMMSTILFSSLHHPRYRTRWETFRTLRNVSRSRFRVWPIWRRGVPISIRPGMLSLRMLVSFSHLSYLLQNKFISLTQSIVLNLPFTMQSYEWI